MKLNTAKLAETARNGIFRAQADQIKWDDNVDAAEAEWEEQWRTVGVEQWRAFRDTLTKALKSGAPITKDQMPVIPDRYSDDRGPFYRPFNRGRRKNNGYPDGQFTADHPYGPRPVLQIAAFEQLIEFLETVEDETVTTSQLERVGFRSLNKLFEAAANGHWS
jgi:hypothetical protein